MGSSHGMNGTLSILKWVQTNGCPWDEQACNFAAKNGHFEVLKWSHANGCSLSSTTCRFAAENGHLAKYCNGLKPMVVHGMNACCGQWSFRDITMGSCQSWSTE
jgi:hypothetical protein